MGGRPRRDPRTADSPRRGLTLVARRADTGLVNRFALLLVVVAASLGVSAAALASGDPRDEKERLTAADNALARRTVVTARDLGSSWRPAPTSSSDERIQCPGFNPDYSAFTITGKAQSAFVQGSGASVVSAVEVYATRAQAAGDFRVGAKPALARCYGRSLARELGRAGFTTNVVSARMVAAPRVGELRAAWRIVLTASVGVTRTWIHVDVVGAQRGRSIAALVFTGIGEPLAGQAALARRVAARMR